LTWLGVDSEVRHFMSLYPSFIVSLAFMVIAFACFARQTASAASPSIRVATFNTSLNRNEQGELQRDLEGDNLQAKQVAAILQHVRPDVVLLNEFDWDAEGKSADLFVTRFLASGQFGERPIEYGYRFTAPVNTGEPTGFDLDGDGRNDQPQDAHGFGTFPGQYGMLVLSRYPIDPLDVRTFQSFLWKDLPNADLPVDPRSAKPYYTDETLAKLRLSSKSHWDVPVQVADRVLHLLACHPTPPVFDGPEDRNGKRNQDEIRFWVEYLSETDPTESNFVDDHGKRGGLAHGASFVIAGDLNSDPHDGDSRHTAIQTLVAHPSVNGSDPPRSDGAVIRAKEQGGVNVEHVGDPAHDTADFYDKPPRGSGNLRVDYVLPSANLKIVASGVFWPKPGDVGADWIRCSDHRLVWVDVQLDE